MRSFKKLTKASFLFMFGNREEYLRRERAKKRQIMECTLAKYEREYRQDLEKIERKEANLIRNWKGQDSTDLQYDGVIENL